jgi:hypothetical protein
LRSSSIDLESLAQPSTTALNGTIETYRSLRRLPARLAHSVSTQLSAVSEKLRRDKAKGSEDDYSVESHPLLGDKGSVDTKSTSEDPESVQVDDLESKDKGSVDSTPISTLQDSARTGELKRKFVREAERLFNKHGTKPPNAGLWTEGPAKEACEALGDKLYRDTLSKVQGELPSPSSA